MKAFPILSFLAVLCSSVVLAQDAALSIEPDPYVSSDHVTICRVVARNRSRHTLQGKAIAFEAQAWENGVLVARERGRFAGAVPPGETSETRIGFNGVFTMVTVSEIPEESLGKRNGSRKAAKPRTGSKTSRSSKSRAPKGSRAK